MQHRDELHREKLPPPRPAPQAPSAGSRGRPGARDSKLPAAGSRGDGGGGEGGRDRREDGVEGLVEVGLRVAAGVGRAARLDDVDDEVGWARRRVRA